MKNVLKVSRAGNLAPPFAGLLVVVWVFMVAGMLVSCTPHPHVVQTRIMKVTLHEVPTDPRAIYAYLVARTKWLNGDTNGALKAYQQALKYDPASLYLHLETTRLLWSLGRIPEAIAQANIAKNLYPKNPDVYELLGNLYYDNKQWKKAIDAFEQVVRLAPDRVKPYLFLSSIYADQKDYEHAVKTLKTLLKRHPDSIMGNFYLGKVFLQLNMLKESQRYLQKVLKMRPTLIPALSTMGDLYMQQNAFKKAAKVYQRILSLDPQNDDARWNLSQAYVQLGEMDQALNLLKELKQREGDGNIDIKIGLIYFHQKKYNQAISVFKKALQDHPGNNRIRYYLATTYGEMKNLQMADKYLSEIPPSSTLYTRATLQRAYLHRKAGKNEKAVSILQEAIKKKPKVADFYLALSELLRQEKRYQDAKQVMSRALALFPKNGDVYFEMGVVYDRLKDKKTCIEMMKKAIELNPKDAAALNYLGYTYAEKGVHLDKAEELIQRALKIRPNAGYIVDSMGWVYYQKGEYEKALKYLKRAVSLSSGDAVIFEHLGDTYIKLGKKAEALDAYRHALKKAKKKKVIQRLHEKIQHLQTP